MLALLIVCDETGANNRPESAPEYDVSRRSAASVERNKEGVLRKARGRSGVVISPAPGLPPHRAIARGLHVGPAESCQQCCCAHTHVQML